MSYFYVVYHKPSKEYFLNYSQGHFSTVKDPLDAYRYPIYPDCFKSWANPDDYVVRTVKYSVSRNIK